MSAGSPRLLPEHIALPKSATEGKAKVELLFDHRPTFDEVREAYLVQLLEAHDGNRQEVARALGISERNTYRLIKKLQPDIATI
jgi:DNA-binding NtrC family response regulator